MKRSVIIISWWSTLFCMTLHFPSGRSFQAFVDRRQRLSGTRVLETIAPLAPVGDPTPFHPRIRMSCMWLTHPELSWGAEWGELWLKFPHSYSDGQLFHHQGRELAVRGFGQQGLKIHFITFTYFFFFIYVWSTACYSSLLPSSLTAQCQSSTSKLETARSRSEIAFWWVRFHAEQEAAAQRWIGRARLSGSEMWWTSEFYWHASARPATAASTASPESPVLRV